LPGKSRKPAAIIRATISSWILFIVSALAPLPLGSNEPISIATWCIVLGACVIIAPVAVLRPPQLGLVALAGIIIIAYAFVLHEQLAVHPWLAAPHPIWHRAEQALGTPLIGSVSVARNQPLFDLGRPMVCMLAIAAGFLVGCDPKRALQLMKVIAWSGAMYAAYGIVAHLFDPKHILGYEKQAYLDAVTGTFVNRNTAGAYFGSCAVIWSVLFWKRVRGEMPPGLLDWRAIPKRIYSRQPKRVLIAAAMGFLCLVALFLTGSRGAVAISLLAMLIAFVTFFFRRHLPSWSGLGIAVAGCGAGAFLLMHLLGGAVNARFDLEGLSDEGRWETYKATARMIADHPWFGTGQGTYAYAFPAYRSANVPAWGVWDMAHNALLQLAAEMGVPIAAAVVFAWLVVFGVLLLGTRDMRRDPLIPVAALAVATIAVLHSLIDFSLQIPGYSIVALSLIGAGLARVSSRKAVTTST
jgi:O-antigen ligase